MNVKERLRERLDRLAFDFEDFSVDRFVSHIEDQTQRKILFMSWLMPPGMFGAWVSDAERDYEYIFYARDTSPIHQVHIKLHELAHFLCGHPTLRIDTFELRRLLQIDSGTGIFGSAALRSTHTAAHEEEAEMMAALIQEEVLRRSQIELLTKSTPSDEEVAKFLTALELD